MFTVCALAQNARRSGKIPERTRNQQLADNLVRLLPKAELIDRHRFRSHTEARMAVFQFIEGFYNPSRRHSALGYLSPIEYERRREGLIKPP